MLIASNRKIETVARRMNKQITADYRKLHIIIISEN